MILHLNDNSFSENFCQKYLLKSLSQLLIAWTFLITSVALANSPKAKYGPEAIPLSLSHEYFQSPDHPANQFWALIPYYVPQRDPASCSVATITMIINAARTKQKLTAQDSLITEKSILNKVKHPAWKQFLGHLKSGVTLDEMSSILQASLKTYQIPYKKIQTVHIEDASSNPKSELQAQKLHEALIDLNKNSNQFILINFLQGIYTGDADVGHFAPLGAYDSEKKRALILDPDREWYEPYWVSEETLLKGMATKDSQAKLNRGYIVVTLEAQ